MKFKKIYSIYVLVFIIMFSTIINPVNAAELMYLDEIKPGMKGFARTVFHGYKIEEFPIQILDIVEDQGLDKDLILFKASGEKIEQTGGIAAGMSGSPVYIDGKLVGAIGYGWSLSDHRYGMITPIEEMLKLLENETIKEDNEKVFKLNTPLFISGMSGRAFNRMKDRFEGLGFRVLKGGGFSSVEGSSESLEPGSAIAVQLVRGDINVASVGTLTYKENEKILAFGHPFFNKGKAEYLLSRAYINGVIPSLQTPFKLGSVTDELLGTIEVDKGAGVAGTLNEYPKIIPLSIIVNDKDSNKTSVVNVQMVRDETLLTSLLTNVALQSLDSTLDRRGKGTANVNFKITGKGLPDLGIKRSNVFYSRNDIAAVSLYEIYNIFNILMTNPFQKVDLIDVKLNIEVEDKDNVALIQEAKIINKNIKPGDKLIIEVTLHPYRAESFVKRVFIDLPKDMDPGLATVVIDGGLTGESYQKAIPEEGAENEENNQAIIDGYKDLDSILNDYLERPKNNELIVQIYPGYPVAAANNQSVDSEEEGNTDNRNRKEENTNDKEGQENKKNNTTQTEGENLDGEDQEIKEMFSTDYVLEGSLNLDITVEGESKSESMHNSDSRIVE